MPLISTLANASARGYGMLRGGASVSSYESIETFTVGSGGSSTISFTSIPSTYKHLQIRAIGRSNYSGTSTNLLYKLNGDATASNYSYHALRGDGSTATATGGTSLNLMGNDVIVANTAAANLFGTVVCDILDYGNTSKNKTVRALGGRDANGSGFLAFDSSLWLSTAVVTQIDIYPQNGSWMQYSHFALYGIKG